MLDVDCLDIYGNYIDHYTQWDIDQTMRIVVNDADDAIFTIAPEVHFANAKSKEALIVRSTVENYNTISVAVPNILLQERYPLLVYIYLTDRTDVSSQKTIIKLEIPVHPRARPSDYEYIENIERITAEQIKQEIEEELADKMYGSELILQGLTFKDVVTGILFKMYVSNGKMILENLDTTANRARKGA